MHIIRQKLALIIIGIELVLLAGVIAAILIYPRKAAAPSSPSTTTKSQAASPKTPVITSVEIADGLTSPTSIATIPGNDSRLFVTERPGRVRSIDAKGAVSEPLLDISSQVLDSGGEMGMLGLAFDPKFAANNRMYVFYINKQKQTVIARYDIAKDSGKAITSSAKTLLLLQQEYGNHKGGQLAFGPDGYLYAGIGDGGSSGDPHNYAQNKNTWFGKILRLDVSGSGSFSAPASNPFAKTADAKPEIWAYGLRNPWRFSFDRENGDLYIPDVGQNAYEEINVQAANSKGGENYGWRCYEGLHEFNTKNCKDKTRYVMPIIEYDHSDNRCSVTGGYVYRGTAEPALTGKYVFAEFCTGEIFYAEKQENSWKTTMAFNTNRHAISTFGEDNNGELYYADVDTGKLYRITDTAN